jgi:uncharacterized protein (DUF3820 family)
MQNQNAISMAISRIIPFGKYKGRNFYEALHDEELFLWITRLAHSPNHRSAHIGQLYLDRIGDTTSQNGLQVSSSQDRFEINTLIAKAREMLAELDAEYTEEHQAVELIRSKLFALLRPSYEKRDDLLIKREYRRRFLEALMKNDKSASQAIAEEEKRASEENRESYEKAANDAPQKTLLSSDEQCELRQIYRKLANLYHPDRYASDLNKQAAFADLMKSINHAKDSGAIDVLREIAMNPNQFLVSRGFELDEIDDEQEIEGLRSILKVLQDKILESQKMLDNLRASSDYELWKLCEQDPSFLEVIAIEQQKDLESDIKNLEEECSSLAKQISELAGPDSPYSA